MAKVDYGNPVGKCETCTINLWDTAGNEPVVWPCNVKSCPYENPDEQHSHFNIATGGAIGSGLGQIDF